MPGDTSLTVVGEAEDGIEAVRQAEALHPDVVLMADQIPDSRTGIGPGVRLSDVLTERERQVLIEVAGGGAGQASARPCQPTGVFKAWLPRAPSVAG